MSTVSLGILTASGVAVGLLAAGVVYADGRREGVDGGSRLLLAAAVGLGCVGAFLVPYVFAAPLRTAYFRLLKPRPTAISPLEWLTVRMATGLLLSVLLGAGYAAGRRYTAHDSSADGR